MGIQYVVGSLRSRRRLKGLKMRDLWDPRYVDVQLPGLGYNLYRREQSEDCLLKNPF